LTNIADIFSPKGPLAKAMPGYTVREAQVEMAEAVQRVLHLDGVLLAEAGTGTGKTLAYLVPTVLSQLKAVVSTGTKNLQEQVYFKDIAFLEKALGTTIDAVYLKGQDNYLCKRRLGEFLRNPAVLAYPPEKVAALRAWASTTETGDRMEMAALGDDDPLFGEVSSTRETRVGSRCRFYKECFVTKARQRAMAAQIVVVNHHLYFADVVTRLQGGNLLPPHEVLIMDEAHTVEDVASEFFSTKVSTARVDRLVGGAVKSIKVAGLADDPALAERETLALGAKRAAEAFFEIFRGPPGRDRLVPEDLGKREVDAYHRLDSALDAFEQSLNRLEGRDESVDHAAMRCRELRDELAKVVTESEAGCVRWVDNRKRSVVLGASPIDVSSALREGIFFQVPKVVLTSATLSTGGDFAYLKSRVGIDFDVEEMAKPSPFDFERQAALYLPRDLPDPRSDDFTEKASSEAARLIRLTRGGALVLSTSLANMKAIQKRLEGEVPGLLLTQGEAPKSTLLEAFLSRDDSVLVATASFWQGVDLAGSRLRLVIIDKLPFSSPGDPLEAARIAHLTEQGKRAFIDYQVPKASLQLKQGFGRLVRSERDRGIVAILDRRLQTMPYAGVFLRSLPPCPRIHQLTEIEAWWQRHGTDGHDG
jgi:ATP-dependent DNA helicase DinG